MNKVQLTQEGELWLNHTAFPGQSTVRTQAYLTRCVETRAHLLFTDWKGAVQ